MSSNNPGNIGNPPVGFPSQGVHPVQVFPTQAVLSGQVHPGQPPGAQLHTAQSHPIQAHSLQPHPVQAHPVQPHPAQPLPAPSHQNENHPAQGHSSQSYPAASHPPQATQSSQPQTQPIPQQQMSDNDPLVKYQQLLPILKESVVNLIKCTVSILQNISSGSCKQSEMQQLNKCMEDFYNISDQVHHWLVLADTTVGHYLTGLCFSTEVTSSFTTQPTPPADGESPKDVLFYSQFLLNARRHVAASSKLRNMLTEFADELGNGS